MQHHRTELTLAVAVLTPWPRTPQLLVDLGERVILRDHADGGKTIKAKALLITIQGISAGCYIHSSQPVALRNLAEQELLGRVIFYAQHAPRNP